MADNPFSYRLGSNLRSVPSWIKDALDAEAQATKQGAQNLAGGVARGGKTLADFGMNFYRGLTGNEPIAPPPGFEKPAEPAPRVPNAPMVPPPQPPQDFTAQRPSWMNTPGIPADQPTPAPSIPLRRTPMEAEQAIEATRGALPPVQAPGSRPPLSFSWGKDVKLGPNGRPVESSTVRDQFGGPKVAANESRGGGGVSYPGGGDGSDNGIGSEAHLRNLDQSGDLTRFLEDRARQRRADALIEDPFAPENAQVDRAIRIAEGQANARQDARFAPYDQAVDEQAAQDLREIESVPDGAQTQLGPMTPEIRARLKAGVEEWKKKQRLDARSRTFRAPTQAEISAEG
jgi:hypothetical protein